MSEINTKRISPPALLRLFANILDVLRSRGILRTRNNPVSDYTLPLGPASCIARYETSSYDPEENISADEAMMA